MRFLWFLSLSYAMVLVFANLFDPRLVNIFGMVTDAGTIIFPLTFILSDVITEVYGYKHARHAIWVGFLFNALFVLYGQIVIHLPNPPYPTHNDAFTTLFTLDRRILVASAISYLFSEPLNSYVLAKLKIKSKGRHMPLRFVASTFISSGVDSLIFGCIAFYGMMSNYNLLQLIVIMWLIKVVMEVAGLPLSVGLARWLKRAENMDIYDADTKFSVFNLECQYEDEHNRYTRAQK